MNTGKIAYILPIAAVFFLFGCIPIPYTVHEAAPDPDETEVLLQELQSSGASRLSVIGKLGKPLRYRKDHISYEACKDTHGFTLILPVLYGAFEGPSYEPDPQCFELLLDFDQQNRLIGYRKLTRDWNYDKREENRYLLTLANEGDTVAQELRKKLFRKRSNLLGKTDEEIKIMAEAGKADAQLKLYWNDREESNAIKWLCRAADNGSTEAQYRIGQLYENGADGVPIDLAKAYMWYSFSAIPRNYMKSYDSAQQLYGDMTAEQRQEVHLLIYDWKEGNCERDLAYVNAM